MTREVDSGASPFSPLSTVPVYGFPPFFCSLQYRIELFSARSIYAIYPAWSMNEFRNPFQTASRPHFSSRKATRQRSRARMGSSLWSSDPGPWGSRSGVSRLFAVLDHRQYMVLDKGSAVDPNWPANHCDHAAGPPRCATYSGLALRHRCQPKSRSNHWAKIPHLFCTGNVCSQGCSTENVIHFVTSKPWS